VKSLSRCFLLFPSKVLKSANFFERPSKPSENFLVSFGEASDEGGGAAGGVGRVAGAGESSVVGSGGSILEFVIANSTFQCVMLLHTHL